MLDILAQEAPTYGVHLSEEQLRQFERYLDLLTSWSKRANLVGDVSPGVVQRRHFLESLALGAALREREILRPESEVLDLGAGAGFPGVPLKILWPGIRLTLIEATGKKTVFLAELAETLGLSDLDTVSGRAETLAHDPALRGRFSVVLARAVAPLATLVELGLPFARLGGRLVSPKGSRAQAEVEGAANALRTLGGRALVLPFPVPGPPQKLVVVVKTAPTPDVYPRQPGRPGKAPL